MCLGVYLCPVGGGLNLRADSVSLILLAFRLKIFFAVYIYPVGRGLSLRANLVCPSLLAFRLL